MAAKIFHFLFHEFRLPMLVSVGIIVYLILEASSLHIIALIIIIPAILLGSFQLLQETYVSLLRKEFALDYIAILAVIVSLLTQEYLVGSIIALMIASGHTLESYSVHKAKESLTKLVERIPGQVTLWNNGHMDKTVRIEEAKTGDIIAIRKGEIIPLDGKLNSPHAFIDESTLTGESLPAEKETGDIVKSGTINVGELAIMIVTKTEKDSTYRKIIELVQKAQQEKAPLIRLANRYSTIFTIITFAIATAAYIINPHLESILAVLVVATPCPLILATPIALLGGVNAASKKRIIIKKLASLEVLARVNAIIFDKTGTITLGKPTVIRVEILEKKYDQQTVLGIAEAIERNSLHPLAKAIVSYAKAQKAPVFHAERIEESIGTGIHGQVNKKGYHLRKYHQENTYTAIALYEKDKTIAVFTFKDKIKKDVNNIIAWLEQQHIALAIFTGDKQAQADEIARSLNGNIIVKAELSPAEKQHGVKELRQQGKITAMIGDGINDAPALALADVGMVFSHEEQTVASSAADIVFLGGDFSLVYNSLQIARRAIQIAKQSIFWGIGLSIAAMIFAAAGVIPPLAGAIIQEAIDVAVILNALRASR